MNKNDNLWVIIPVYNEALNIKSVIETWHNVLKPLEINFKFCLLNDGSTDNTMFVLKELESQFSNIVLIDKTNTGHGQTCLYGYKYALENGADYIFQIDSDGQCDPMFFKNFLPFITPSRCVYGYRYKREDGRQRIFITLFVPIFTYIATGIWVKDPNVPYRIMPKSVLEKFVFEIPLDFILVNILVSVCCKKYSSITWVPIIFRDRKFGTPSIKNFKFIKHGFTLVNQLKSFIKKAR
ncbi:MAG: glycosyltransferase family 2 protein [Alphaproteobacteria bacterium]|nr:glycosyltransferase family 2 protein [Alphaproteobacteria bacterium]